MRIILCIFLFPFIYSFNFSPMTQTIDLESGQKTATYQIENTTDQTIPVTIKAVRRIQKIDGKEELPSTSDLKVFPPQLIIPKGEKKTIRVDWKGDPKFNIEKSYRIIAEQVPLDLEKKKQSDKGGIKMLLKYMNALYVDPGKTKSSLKVDSYKIKKKLYIILSNLGTKHQYLKNLKIKFSKGKSTYSINKEELKLLDGQNILAKTKRSFEFKAPKGLTEGLKVSLTFDD